MTAGSRSVPMRRVAATVAMAALFLAVAAPALAGSPAPPSNSPFSSRALTQALADVPVVASTVPAPPVTPDAKAPQPQKGSFLSSRTGLLVLSAFVAGTGYALYSAKHDRIRGQTR